MNLRTGLGTDRTTVSAEEEGSIMADDTTTIEERKARLLDQLEDSTISEAEITTIERKLSILKNLEG